MVCFTSVESSGFYGLVSVAHDLKHVKAWLKPNLHKIRKTIITLPGFNIILLELTA